MVHGKLTANVTLNSASSMPSTFFLTLAPMDAPSVRSPCTPVALSPHALQFDAIVNVSRTLSPPKVRKGKGPVRYWEG